MLILLLAAMFAAAQSPLERAVTLAREKRYAEARQALAGAQEPATLPQRIAFHRLRAAVASGLGEAANAAAEMRAALELDPGNAGLLLATAVAESDAGDLDHALQHAASAGNTAPAQALTGDIQEKRGQYVQAAKAYQAAVELAPDQEQYRIALALELVQHHTFEAAILVLEQAAKLFPMSARIETLLGIANYASQHIEVALASLTRAVELDPALKPAEHYLVQVALESPTQISVGALAAVCRSDAVSCAALKLRVSRHQGDIGMQKEAMAELRRAPADNPVARCELGRAYEWLEQWAEARAQMEACVRLNPSPENHYRLGLDYSRLGLRELSRKEMELRNQAAERLSDDVARRASAAQAFEYVVK